MKSFDRVSVSIINLKAWGMRWKQTYHWIKDLLWC